MGPFAAMAIGSQRIRLEISVLEIPFPDKIAAGIHLTHDIAKNLALYFRPRKPSDDFRCILVAQDVPRQVQRVAVVEPDNVVVLAVINMLPDNISISIQLENTAALSAGNGNAIRCYGGTQ